ncbi:hypothetical protein [Elizabethkingia anophelis]|uniref:hypothetical protein n=1 Tax=Elizabethkingia anophelis TaxID=1117645 RepID=UPI003891E26D
MKKKLLCIPLLGILAMSLSSCRSEDTIVQQTQNKEASKNFAVFTPKKAGETIDYAKGFAYLMQRYDKLQKTNLSGINNKHIIGNLNASTEKNASIFQDTESYVEFSVRSQVITEENGDKWVVYPKIKENKVIALVVATLTEKGTYVKYDTFKAPHEWFNKNVLTFQEAINRLYNKENSLSLSASVRDVAPIAGSSRCVKIPNGYDCGIDGVIINGGKPAGGGSGGGGGENPEPGTGGGCGPHEDCSAPEDLGGSGDYSNYEFYYLIKPKYYIRDLKKYLNTLDKTKPAYLTVFAESMDHGWPGHAFISILQGNKRITFGFYPDNPDGKLYRSIASPGIMGDNSGSVYTHSKDFGEISPTQLSKIMDTALNYDANSYQLSNTNCSDFAWDVMKIAGDTGLRYTPMTPDIIIGKFGSGVVQKIGHGPDSQGVAN